MGHTEQVLNDTRRLRDRMRVLPATTGPDETVSPWEVREVLLGTGLGGPAIVCLGGLTKPVRSPASPRDYRRVRQFADEFRKRRTVYQPDPDR